MHQAPSRSNLRLNCLDSSSSSRMSPRRVTFNNLAQCRLTIHAADLSEKVKRRCWYSRREIHAIHSQNRASALRAMEKCKVTDEENLDDNDISQVTFCALPISSHYARGLEGYIPKFAEIRHSRRQVAFEVVFNAQEKQADPSIIAKAYAQVSLNSRVRAFKLAAHDETEARKSEDHSLVLTRNNRKDLCIFERSASCVWPDLEGSSNRVRTVCILPPSAGPGRFGTFS